jgi:uncharacterized protein (DUF433 family)
LKIDRITIDQKVHFGKPCIAGTRIPVYCVLELVQAGIQFNEIISKHYPDITFDDVKACIQYAVELVKAEEVHVGES